MIPDLSIYSHGDLLVVRITDFVLCDQIRPELITHRHVLCSAEATNEFRRLNIAGGDVIEDAEPGDGLPVVSIDDRQLDRKTTRSSPASASARRTRRLRIDVDE